MALTERSGSGFIVGGVTDTTPDWLGSYNEGVNTAIDQTTARIGQQEARQRMAESAAAEQRRAQLFSNEQADRAAALEAARLGAQMPPEVPFDATRGAGLMPEYQVPVAPEPRAPSEKYAGELATTPAPGAITSDQRMQMLPEWARLEQALGLPNNYLETISMLESSGGTNVGTGQYTGVFQVGPEVAAEFGVTPEQLRDPRVNAQVAAKLAAKNANFLRGILGRDPQGWEIYLAHQQGRGGAAALIRNPNANVVDALTPAYGGDRNKAMAAVTQNGGNPNGTAGEFAKKWADKFGGAVPQPFTGGPSAQGGGEAPPEMVSTPSPTASPLRNDINEFLAKRNRRDVYYNIINDLRESPLRGVYDYMFSDQATAEQNAAQSATRAEALQWYQLDEVGNFFNKNPAALVEAQRDPISYFEQNSDAILGAAAEEGAKGDLPAGVAVPGAPPATAAPAAPTATPGLQTQPTTPASGAPAAPATPGLQTQPPTQLNLAPIAARDLIPSTSAADYAGLDDGTGSLATAVARTRTGEVPKTPDTGMYIVEPMRITNDRRLLAAQKAEIQRQLQMASTTRDFTTIYKLRDQAVQNQLADNLLGAMEVIATMQQGDDETFAKTLSGLTQNRQQLQRRSDGTFNIYYDNQLVGEGIPRNQIIASLRMQYDQQYQALAAAQAKAAGERDLKLLESELKTREQVTAEEAKMYANIAAKRDELEIKNANPEYNITVGDDGTVTAVPKTGNPTPIRFEPQPILDPDGEPVLDGEGNPRYKLVPMPVQGR